MGGGMRQPFEPLSFTFRQAILRVRALAWPPAAAVVDSHDLPQQKLRGRQFKPDRLQGHTTEGQ